VKTDSLVARYNELNQPDADSCALCTGASADGGADGPLGLAAATAAIIGGTASVQESTGNGSSLRSPVARCGAGACVINYRDHQLL